MKTITLTDKEYRLLLGILAKAFLYRTLFHSIAGLPGTKEYDTELMLRTIHEKLEAP